MKTKSAIKDIFNGFRGHIDTMKLPKDAKRNGDLLCKTYDELEQRLSPELFELHQTFVDALEKDFSEDVDFFFAEGFKLGLLIGIESMED